MAPACRAARPVPHGLVPARHAVPLQTLSLDVPEGAVAAYEAALQSVCGATGLFINEPDRAGEDGTSGMWRVEGVKAEGADEPALRAALLMAEAVTGVAAAVIRTPVAAEGWLARTAAAFPEQLVGQRFAVRGTHLPPGRTARRITLWIDAGVAFGSGEHGSTRGCLRALEFVVRRKVRGRVLDLGTGSGVLAMAAALLLHRPVLATDIDPWSVRTARDNARLNRLRGRVRGTRADGWRGAAIGRAAPFGLVFANILARPLCAMSGDLARRLAPGGTAILAGLLDSQVRLVLAAHRRFGLLPARVLLDGRWATLVLRKPATSGPLP